MKVMKAGIWMDKKTAFIVTLDQNEAKLEKVGSEADFRPRIDGEGKAYTRFGDQYYTEEKKQQARLEKQLRDYYEALFNKIKDREELYVFGPAEGKTEFEKLLREKKTFMGSVTLQTHGKLTENQIVAEVKNFFNS